MFDDKSGCCWNGSDHLFWELVSSHSVSLMDATLDEYYTCILVQGEVDQRAISQSNQHIIDSVETNKQNGSWNDFCDTSTTQWDTSPVTLFCHRWFKHTEQTPRSQHVCKQPWPNLVETLTDHPRQWRTELRWRPEQESSLAPPCSSLRPDGSRCIVETFRHPQWFGARGIVPSLIPSVRPWPQAFPELRNNVTESWVLIPVESKKVFVVITAKS